MANIAINNLSATGFDLLLDKESYLNEINDDEIGLMRGGALSTPVCASIGVFMLTYGFSMATRKIHDYNKSIIARL
ncbi:MAG: hypothetical protein RMX96_26545 [Nostoc sp. ChiSLP02]|nr:hypothetical protein [Nostoc sp. DedSLP05]MDZ8102329.1 hypothetical protein [Nostoc sp. DedSLP01]MDZ8188404.1 hypothetical protein [Nostoc sp. ChiSLP02]